MAFRGLLRDLGQRVTVIVSHAPGRGRRRRLPRGRTDGHREDRVPRHPGRAHRQGRGQRRGGRCPAGARLQCGACGRPVRYGSSVRAGRTTGMTATTEAPVRHRIPGPARAIPQTAARLAPDRVAPQPDAADPAADRAAVLVRHLPAQHHPATDMGAARVLEHGPGTHHHRLRAVRGGHGRLDRIAGRPARHGRPGHRRRPAALGGSARLLGRDRHLGGGRLPGLRGRAVRGLHPPGRLGRAPVVVGRGRRDGGGRVQRGRVRRRSLLPQPVRRAAGRVRRVPRDDDVVADRVQPAPAAGR